MRMKSLIICINLLLIGMAAAGCTKKEVPTIRVKGSTTMAPITRKLAEAFQSNRNIRIEVKSNGSHFGLDALINGECDIAESSSEATREYVKKAAKAGVVLKAFRIAKDYIVPIVHLSNRMENISLQQLQDIYSGKTTTWEAISQHKGAIEVVGRSEASGTGDVWRTVLGIDGGALSNRIARTSNSGVLAYVAENENALGYISAAFLNSEVKALAVNDTSSHMTKPAVHHPIYRNLYLYVDEKKFNEDMRLFIIFALSTEGQELIKKLGFMPLTAD